jgi:flavin-binding protein dodecin
MAILKVLELMASSTKSWEDAAQQAVNEASHRAVVNKNKIVEYRITAKLSFEIEHSNGGKSKK